jgi:hypothetical protein
MMPSKTQIFLQLRRNYPFIQKITQERRLFYNTYRLYPNKASNQEEIRLNFICTQLKKKSFVPGLGTNCASILISVMCFATLAVLKLLLCSQWQQTLANLDLK